MKKIVRIALTAAMAGGMALGTGGVASAAHCTGTTPEEQSQPGFSYYGNDHVQEADHAEGNNKGGPHMGTQGASNCRETTGSPSERAPGKQQ